MNWPPEAHECPVGGYGHIVRLVLSGDGGRQLRAVEEAPATQELAEEVLRLGTHDLLIIAYEGILAGYQLLRVDLRDAYGDPDSDAGLELSDRLRRLLLAGDLDGALALMQAYSEYFHVSWITLRDRATLTNMRVGRNGVLLAAGDRQKTATAGFIELLQTLLARFANA